MASTLKHLRSSTASKRPTASGLVDGQLAINTASGTPGLFFKDSNGGVVKVGPAHVGSTAPNSAPAGSAGNSLGELWVDNGLTVPGLNYYTGSAFVNLTPSSSTTTVGLVELATSAETQAGSDSARAVTPSGLQSKISDSVSTTSSTTIASSTAVKTAYDLAASALTASGGTISGQLLIAPSGSLVFEGSTDDGFETTLTVVNPTADHTITLPNITGTVITTSDTGTVTSTMIADGTITGSDVASGTITTTNIADNTIVDADINSGAAIAYSKLALSSGIVNTDISASAAIAYGKLALSNSIVNADIGSSAAIAYSKLALSSGIVNTDISASAAIAHSKLANITAGSVLLGNASNIPTATAITGDIGITSAGVTSITAGAIVDADINASAAIAYSKLALSNSIVNADIGTSAAIAYSKLALSSGIVNTDISASAGIVYSKLALSSGIVNTDISASAGIVYSKLALSSGIVNTDISASAGIAYSKLALSSGIVNTDISASAGIVDTKLATISTAGKVSNSATTATSANTASAIVARDSSGNFTAGTITTSGAIELGNASDTTLSRSAAGVLAVEGVVVPTISSTNTLTNKTLTDPAIIGTILEDVFTITDGAAFEVDPGNGSVQLITLGASRTPKATNFAAGESITLMVNDGTAYTLTWTDATWGSGGVIWTGGTAPTLATTGYTVLQFWKVSTQVYGALVGNVA